MKILYSRNRKQRSRELRNNSTLAEVLLWNHLKQRKMLGYQFMRQKPIHHFIVDFYCSKLKLVIEIDGESHRLRFGKDQQRQEYLEQMNIQVLRFNDLDVKKDMGTSRVRSKAGFGNIATLEWKNERQPPNPLC